MVGDQPLAQLDEARRRAETAIRLLEAIEGEMGALGLHVRELLPFAHRGRGIALPLEDGGGSAADLLERPVRPLAVAVQCAAP